MKAFRKPRPALAGLDAETAAGLIRVAADMAVVLDAEGIVQDVALGSVDLARDFAGHAAWLGHPWAEVVATDSRAQAEALLRADGPDKGAGGRKVHQGAADGSTVPLLCTMAKLGAGGTRVVFGRDLRPLSRLRQDIAEAQQAMEQEYARLRQAEGRYRLLFERLADPALILDGTSLRVMEANPAALRLFRHGRHRLPGGLVTEGFAPASREAVRAVLDGVRSGGRADEARALLADGRTEAVVSAAAFRHEGTVLLLLRVTPGAGAGATEALAPEQSRMLKLIDAVPDAFVVTDADGRVVTANAAFLGLAGARSEEEVRGQPLERWLGGQDTEAEVLLAHLRQHGAVRLYRCVLRGEGGPAAEVEVSAATVTRGGQPHFGFSIRDVGPQARMPEAGEARPTRPVEQMARLIGQVPLRDLVREATDAIERICVEAALQLAGDNRSAAAEMLGLSRQSLYQKMHRHGLGGMAEGREPRH